MIETFIWGLRFYIQRTDPVTAIRLAWQNADDPGILDWFVIVLVGAMLLGLAEASRG